MPGNFLTNDLSKILKTEELATMAVYDGLIIVGVFDDEDIEAQMADGTVRIIPQCIFTGRSEDFSAIVEGETMVINNAAFSIRSWIDDGTGMIDVHLEKQ